MLAWLSKCYPSIIDSLTSVIGPFSGPLWFELPYCDSIISGIALRIIVVNIRQFLVLQKGQKEFWDYHSKQAVVSMFMETNHIQTIKAKEQSIYGLRPSISFSQLRNKLWCKVTKLSDFSIQTTLKINKISTNSRYNSQPSSFYYIQNSCWFLCTT